MLPLWFYLGHKFSAPWTFYLTALALIWVAGFVVVDRIRYRRKPSEPGESLLHCVHESLTEVEHQIWLKRRIFWWYLLPPSVSFMAFFVHVSWMSAATWWQFPLILMPYSFFLLALYGGIYYFTQLAVRKDLEPRRHELLTLLASLGDETSHATNADGYTATPTFVSPYAAERNVESAGNGVRNVFVAFLALAAFAAVGLLVLVGPLLDLARHLSAKYSGPAQSSGINADSLARLITEQRQEKDLVGLAAMVMVNGKVERVAAQGERKAGSGVALEVSDRWHVGGITKSITATMISRLIESGQMSWTDTVGEAFPETSTHEVWKPVTLKQLLTDTAGAPVQFPQELWRKQIPPGPDRTLARVARQS